MAEESAELSVDPNTSFSAKAERIRHEMGGLDKIDKIHKAGRRTVREHIDGLVDSGSFFEVGTFVCEPKKDGDPLREPGDGCIGGHARIDSRPVTICADDDTVRRGTQGPRGAARMRRLREMASRRKNPLILLGQSAGNRLPEAMDSYRFASEEKNEGLDWLFTRDRSIPLVCFIIGNSFGGSSFSSAMSDFVVQLDGTCLAISSPRVVEVASGERIGLEELGGSNVHATVTGQIDSRAGSPEEAYHIIRSFLSYLPSCAGGPLPMRTSQELIEDPEVMTLVPRRRTRAYDIRKIIAQVADNHEYLEVKPKFAANIVTALARVGGMPIGVIANQPQHMAGSLTPDGCLKATRFVCTCDAFCLPLLFLVDNPGFLVGSGAEHGRLLSRSMQFMHAVRLSRVPKCTVILRKAFGLGFVVMGGPYSGADLRVAWPGAEIGFMDPKVAANVLYGSKATGLAPEEAEKFFEHQADLLSADFAPYGVASSMAIDEIIAPELTRKVVAETLAGLHESRTYVGKGQLSNWPFVM